MPRWVDFHPKALKRIEKLKHRDPVTYYAIKGKLAEILEQPEHYKPLRGDLHGLRRVHFGSHVLKFKVVRDSVLVMELEHHDRAYD